MSKDSIKPHRIDVSIGGVTYHLLANENEEYMRMIAAKADEAYQAAMVANPSLSGMQNAVLLIINLMDSLEKISSEYDTVLEESKKAVGDLEACSKELYVQRDVNFEMKKELLRVNELNKQLMLELASLKTKEEHDDPITLIPPDDPDIYDDEACGYRDGELEPEHEPESEPDPEPEPEPELPEDEPLTETEAEEFSNFNQTTLEEYLSSST
ncbi:MAG: cell division protein ZapA [Eubacteriales bacterium]|nr:cell division protein ZapA [Eubacteriales bacterium]